MRRILINSYILRLSKEYNDSLFYERGVRFRKPINNVGNSGYLIDLEDYLRIDCNLPILAGYTQMIINRYNEIIILQPNKFEYYYNTYFNLDELALATIVIPPIGNNRFAEKEFYKLIIEAMRYDAVRDIEFLPFVKKMGIKSCVYCNAQFSITTERQNGNLSGMFELDHFYPKSKYPFLSTSFFNLQPCCSHCNKTKSDRLALFSLYTSDHKSLEPFSFSLDKKSMIRYLLTQDEDELVISFNSVDLNLKINHENLFHITELYKQHKDIIEELIWKSKVYNKSYKDSLSDSFAKFFPNSSNFNRFILSNYDNPKDIHRRPLAKMVQDIAKELGIII